MRVAALVCGMGLLLLAGGCARLQTVQDVEWRLSEVHAGGEVLALGTDAPVFSLNLGKDGKATGRVACNRWHAGAQVGKTELQLADAGTTRMRCNFDDRRFAELEQRFLPALQQPVPYRLDGKRLVINPPGEEWVFSRE